MQFNYLKRVTVVVALMMSSASIFSQVTVATNDKMTTSSNSGGAPTTKDFRKFSFEITAGALEPSVITGGTNNFSSHLATVGYGAGVKYQIFQFLGLQADVFRGKVKGNQDKSLGNGLPPGRAVTSFTTDLHSAASVSAVLTLGNINWLSSKLRVVPYLAAGGGIMRYDVKFVKAGTTTEQVYSARKPIREFFVPVTAGLKFNVSDLINIDLGYRANYIDGDNFDGYNSGFSHKDKLSYGFAGLEFSLGKRSKKQLMFDNPLGSIREDLQRQIDSLKAIPPYRVKDTDGDGVVDELDLEPNTPKGCPVDTHGVMRDTDGDGVPDCKDKELNTPTMCQPVDADGVGKCPPPECCKNITTGGGGNNGGDGCTIGDLPSISFKSASLALKSDAKAMLATVATKLKANPTCTVMITGYPATTKASEARCQSRLAMVRKYLMENEGISGDRVNTNCVPGGGDENTVDMKGAGK